MDIKFVSKPARVRQSAEIETDGSCGDAVGDQSMRTILLKQVVDVIRRWRRRKAAARDLSALNDRLLRDRY